MNTYHVVVVLKKKSGRGRPDRWNVIVPAESEHAAVVAAGEALHLGEDEAGRVELGVALLEGAFVCGGGRIAMCG